MGRTRDHFELPCLKGEVVFVTWEDALSESEREQEDDLLQTTTAVNTNVGWIIHRDRKRIILAHGKSSTGEVDRFVIPAKNILKITSVKRPSQWVSRK